MKKEEEDVGLLSSHSPTISGISALYNVAITVYTYRTLLELRDIVATLLELLRTKEVPRIYHQKIV